MRRSNRSVIARASRACSSRPATRVHRLGPRLTVAHRVDRLERATSIATRPPPTVPDRRFAPRDVNARRSPTASDGIPVLHRRPDDPDPSEPAIAARCRHPRATGVPCRSRRPRRSRRVPPGRLLAALLALASATGGAPPCRRTRERGSLPARRPWATASARAIASSPATSPGRAPSRCDAASRRRASSRATAARTRCRPRRPASSATSTSSGPTRPPRRPRSRTSPSSTASGARSARSAARRSRAASSPRSGAATRRGRSAANGAARRWVRPPCGSSRAAARPVPAGGAPAPRSFETTRAACRVRLTRRLARLNPRADERLTADRRDELRERRWRLGNALNDC